MESDPAPPIRKSPCDVCNHIANRQLLDYLGSNRFVYQGYAEFFLKGRWIKCIPAFIIDTLPKTSGGAPEFNKLEDSIFHAYSEGDRNLMEYLTYHDEYAVIPVEKIVAAWKTE